MELDLADTREMPSIWWFAFGYFAAYAPYSALTKAVSKGLLGQPKVGEFELLPPSVLASMVGMFVFLSAMRWWRYATHYEIGGFRVPGPTRFTVISGLTTAAIVATTTLSYAFTGVSIVFMMLLMRGGVLIIAPLVDLATGRSVRWYSVVALLLSLGALVAAFVTKAGFEMQVAAVVDVIVYLLAYFVRLRLMTGQAKSNDPNANVRFFVEEQMVATPSLFLLLVVGALIGTGDMLAEIRQGFTTFWTESGVVGWVLLIGFLSQGTGIFGGLILLDKRENTFCVPVNRSSSIIAGIVAAWMLTIWLDNPAPGTSELVGAALIIAALLFLSIPPLVEKQRAARAQPLAVSR